MMGTRERLCGGAEYDAFSRRARRIHHSPHHGLKAIKQKFWRRVRHGVRCKLRREI